MMFKKSLMAILGAGVLFAVEGYASDSPRTGQSVSENVQLQKITIDAIEEKELDAFSKGERPGYILEVPSQTWFPVRFLLTGDIIALDSLENTEELGIKLLKTVYVKNGGQQFLFSHDGIQWKPFSDFFTGTAAISLGKKDGKLVGSISADLNAR